MRLFHQVFVIVLSILFLRQFSQAMQAAVSSEDGQSLSITNNYRVNTQLLQSQKEVRRYFIKPLDVGASVDVRARSTRSLQVRVTDDKDKPVPDLPVIFTVTPGNGQDIAGTFSGGLSRQVTTNTKGIATIEFQSGPLIGVTTFIKVQVVGSDSVEQIPIKIVNGEPSVGQPLKDATQPSTSTSENTKSVPATLEHSGN